MVYDWFLNIAKYAYHLSNVWRCSTRYYSVILLNTLIISFVPQTEVFGTIMKHRQNIFNKNNHI